MNKIAKDCQNAGEYVNEFLNIESETFLRLSIDSDYESRGYTIVKLPHTKNIVFLYGVQLFNNSLRPGCDLRYMGFYHIPTKQAYDIRDPFDCFFRFEHKYISEDTLKTMAIEAVQKAVADCIAAYAEEGFGGVPFTVSNSDITADAEKAFSKKETVLDFAKKITVNSWSISHGDLVSFIDNRENFLKTKAEDRIRGSKEELARLWTAHCTAQKLLDRLNAENA